MVFDKFYVYDGFQVLQSSCKWYYYLVSGWLYQVTLFEIQLYYLLVSWNGYQMYLLNVVPY